MQGIDVFCVFPRAVEAAVRVGVVGRAIERGLVGFRAFDLRDFSSDGRIDDMPFGGGPGMIIRVDIVARALEEVYGMPARKLKEERRVVVTEAWGHRIDQDYVREVVSDPRDLTIICGRYGGIDERVSRLIADEVISLGEFVLSGGEIAAAALSDAVIRQMEGVLGNSESLLGESFSSGRDAMGPPQYTRPAEWDGERVPAVLLSGNHEKIRAWREREARLRAAECFPDPRPGARREAAKGENL